MSNPPIIDPTLNVETQTSDIIIASSNESTPKSIATLVPTDSEDHTTVQTKSSPHLPSYEAIISEHLPPYTAGTDKKYRLDNSKTTTTSFGGNYSVSRQFSFSGGSLSTLDKKLCILSLLQLSLYIFLSGTMYLLCSSTMSCQKACDYSQLYVSRYIQTHFPEQAKILSVIVVFIPVILYTLVDFAAAKRLLSDKTAKMTGFMVMLMALLYYFIELVKNSSVLLEVARRTEWFHNFAETIVVGPRILYASVGTVAVLSLTWYLVTIINVLLQIHLQKLIIEEDMITFKFPFGVTVTVDVEEIESVDEVEGSEMLCGMNFVGVGMKGVKVATTDGDELVICGGEEAQDMYYELKYLLKRESI